MQTEAYLRRLFGVGRDTIGKWRYKFSEYLSASANKFTSKFVDASDKRFQNSTDSKKKNRVFFKGVTPNDLDY